ncbi:heme peroxidase [Auriculariales sp. MPI-PUGE-AT-0066]|nr:heme peroxidase [Auriculariales sp. MPI-PUGE-AT-0066]
MRVIGSPALLVFFQIALAGPHVWPNPQLDYLERLRFDQEGYHSADLTGRLQPCGFDVSIPEGDLSSAADWIRTVCAFHQPSLADDMATHNVATGTGGLDGSIRFAEEQARPEARKLISVMPWLLLTLHESGGPEMPFRGGRVDALVPNDPGIPQPHHDIDTLTAIFAKQGFNSTEMIGLVACGHTIGGVRQAAVPDDVPFDSTFVTFDNKVASEYIAGTTTNPLVVNSDDTMNSDKRVFASDGNATMTSFASNADLFMSTCAYLLTRMIDTVPAGVTLTPVIEPLRVKPEIDEFLYMGDGTLKIRGLLRLWDVNTELEHPAVSMRWKNLNGTLSNEIINLKHETRMIGSTIHKGQRISTAWYWFPEEQANIVLDEARGISSLAFTVDGQQEHQGGLGFAIDDTVLFAASSCTSNPNSIYGRIDVAVRCNLSPSKVYIKSYAFDSETAELITEEFALSLSSSSAAGSYEIWSVSLGATTGVPVAQLPGPCSGRQLHALLAWPRVCSPQPSSMLVAKSRC